MCLKYIDMARKTKFQRTLERRRNILERRGRTMMFRALSLQYAWAFKQIRTHKPSELVKIMDKMPEEPIRLAMNRYYRTFAPLANLYRKDMERQAAKIIKKGVEDDFWINEYERFLAEYVRTTAAFKITAITETTKKRLIRDIQGALRTGVDEGLSIDAISKLILKNARTSLGVNARARSLSIAQTEIIAGSNASADYAAKQTGLKHRKFWSTSGLPNTRETHTFAENWSVQRNGIKENARFNMGDGTFMLYPGDEAGGAANVINCRCSLLIEVVV